MGKRPACAVVLEARSGPYPEVGDYIVIAAAGRRMISAIVTNRRHIVEFASEWSTTHATCQYVAEIHARPVAPRRR